MSSKQTDVNKCKSHEILRPTGCNSVYPYYSAENLASPTPLIVHICVRGAAHAQNEIVRHSLRNTQLTPLLTSTLIRDHYVRELQAMKDNRHCPEIFHAVYC